jgi:hypothetical protein
MMKTTIIALGVLLLAGSTSLAGWYVTPTVAYYPGVPVYAYPAPVYVAPVPYVSYMPVAAAPCACGGYSAPMVAPAPVLVAPAAVVRARVLYPGQPVRNTLKVVVP